MSVWVEIISNLTVIKFWLCHAPRERVSWNPLFALKISFLLMSRSTWACELKSDMTIKQLREFGHAPRERVSWNSMIESEVNRKWSHAPRERVSWNPINVPIKDRTATSHAPRERVSWNRACRPSCYLWCKVTLHVSVWVEIYHEQLRHSACWSRSTWACELKWSMTKAQSKLKSHAPRERVSWNRQYLVQWFQLL